MTSTAAPSAAAPRTPIHRSHSTDGRGTGGKGMAGGGASFGGNRGRGAGPAGCGEPARPGAGLSGWISGAAVPPASPGEGLFSSEAGGAFREVPRQVPCRQRCPVARCLAGSRRAHAHRGEVPRRERLRLLRPQERACRSARRPPPPRPAAPRRGPQRRRPARAHRTGTARSPPVRAPRARAASASNAWRAYPSSVSALLTRAASCDPRLSATRRPMINPTTRNPRKASIFFSCCSGRRRCERQRRVLYARAISA